MEGQSKEKPLEPGKESEADRSHIATKKIIPTPLSTTTSQIPSSSVQKAFVPPLSSHVRYRTNTMSSKPDKTTVVQDNPSPSPSKSPPNVVPPASVLKGKPSRSQVSDSDTSIGCSSKVSTDNHTGAREQVQPNENVNSETQQVTALAQSLNKPKASEKVPPEKHTPKSLPETAPKVPPTDAVSHTASSPNGKKSKGIRKVSSKAQKSPLDVSPLPSAALKELERKASESSIISTNSDSTTSSVDKSEDAETPSQVLLPEVKFEKPEKPPPFTKEPNTGQTIHPTESSDVADAEKSEQLTDPRKKDKDTGTPPPVRIKGKKKLRQQQRKEEKARRREKEREKGRDKERELEREKAESEKFSKRSSGSFEDSSSSNSTEQLEEDLSPPDDYPGEATSLSDEKSVPTEAFEKFEKSAPILDSGVSPTVDKSMETSEPESEQINVTKQPLRESIPGEKGKDGLSPPPQALPVSPANAVPSTAIKTSRGRSTKHQIKDVVTDPFSRMPDRSTYNSKKVSGKKATEKTTTVKTPSLASEKSTPSQVEIVELSEAQVEVQQSSPKQRPQTLPVILTEPDADYDAGDVFIDPGSTETDGISHTLLKVDANKNNSQSLPTSPHELAASLLSNNSAIMRRKQRSDKDKSDDGIEDDEEIAKSEIEVKEISVPDTGVRVRQSGKPSYTTSPQKDGSSHPLPNQFKPLSTPLSLDAEPFYPSPHFQPKPQPNARMADSRKYVEHGRTNPPGFSPTPDDAYMGPYPEQHYLKREHLPPRHHITKSMTPSPPPPFHSFPDGHHILADYPGLDPHDPLGPVSVDEQYTVPDEAPFMHGSMGGGRYSDRYRGRGVAEPHIVAKGGRSRPLGPSSSAFADSYMANLHQQQLAQYHRAVRERNPGAYPPGHGALWDQPKPHRLPPPSVEEPAAQQYLRKRQYLINLVKKERAALAAATIAREQARRSAESISSMGQPQKRGHSSVFRSEMSHGAPFSSRMWDDIEPLSDPLAPMDELSLSDSMLAHQIRQRQQLLHNQASIRPSRSRTYSNESDLGGEFVSDLQSQLPSPSTVGAPGQPFSSRVDRSTKNLAPGRARSSGWPGDSQVRNLPQYC